MFTIKRQKYLANIYDQYSDSIYRFLLLKTSSVEIAQDLTSETFLRFVDRIMGDRLKSDFNRSVEIGFQPVQNPRAFLYKTARNLTVDYYRKKGRVVLMEGVNNSNNSTFNKLEHSHKKDIEEVVKKFDLEKDAKILTKHLTKIPDECAEIIVLRYVEEMPFSEISEIIDKPEGTVRVILHRGMTRLRELLDA